MLDCGAGARSFPCKKQPCVHIAGNLLSFVHHRRVAFIAEAPARTRHKWLLYTHPFEEAEPTLPHGLLAASSGVHAVQHSSAGQASSKWQHWVRMQTTPLPSRIRSRPPVTVFHIYRRCSALTALGPTRCSVSWLMQGLRHWQRVTSSRNSRMGQAAGVFGHSMEPCLTACGQHNPALPMSCWLWAHQSNMVHGWVLGIQEEALLDRLWLAGHQSVRTALQPCTLPQIEGRRPPWTGCVAQLSASAATSIEDSGGQVLVPDLQSATIRRLAAACVACMPGPARQPPHKDSRSTHLGCRHLLLRLCQGERWLLQQLHGWGQLQQFYAAILAAQQQVAA